MSFADYDRDVAVIGGGPAGLAAAIRVRWVKGFDPVPSSVAILDPAPLGGLAGWGSCVLTGPSFSLGGDELVGKLVADIEALSIPHLRHRATRIRREESIFVLEGDGWDLRCLSVVLATGFRALSREGHFYPDGVVIAMKGRSHLPKLLHRAHERASEGALVVAGARATAYLAHELVPLARRSGGLTIVLEQGGRDSLPPELRDRVVEGRIVSVEGEDSVAGVVVEGPDGASVTIPCRALFLDYHAFEIEPVLSIDGLDELEVDFTTQGFVEIDAHGRTTCPGIVAAGDITGRYASTLTALGDGVVAGFSAYRVAYDKKFGCEPDLFAYRGTDRPLSDDAEGPELAPRARPLLIGDAERTRAELTRFLSPQSASRALEMMDGRHDLGEIARHIDSDLAPLRAGIWSAMHARTVTVHVLHDEPVTHLEPCR